jgi:hypothetical protein
MVLQVMLQWHSKRYSGIAMALQVAPLVALQAAPQLLLQVAPQVALQVAPL